jgi:UDP-2-acetamido-2-deoxy-ribo-hexuluronate aminotransferase
MSIEMVDLKGQYLKLQEEIDTSIMNVIRSANYINGLEVESFANNLSNYLDGVFVIPCANGTDALQLALMALDLQPGDEVIVPAFTYVATAEVIALLRLKPVLVDVDPLDFNISISKIELAISQKTKAIVPVHLFGQCADMEPILLLAEKYSLFVVEDTAQALGAKYTFSDGSIKMAGTMGHIGCTSFFPSKNLGCYGDGGAVLTYDKVIADKIRMLANHGQVKKYYHKYVGVNSRLDTIQAAVLNVKLKYLDDFSSSRYSAADKYYSLLHSQDGILLPHRLKNSSHVFHQFTILVLNGKRDDLKNHLESIGVPSMIYYPLPLYEQEAFNEVCEVVGTVEVTKGLCTSVLSLPMHTELTEEDQVFISNGVKSFFNSI